MRKGNVIALHFRASIPNQPVTPPLIKPKPCNDPDCRGDHAPAERVAMALSICRSRGVKLTKHRRQILGLLWEHGRPTGAYELIEALKQTNDRPIAPPTVYRALEFLVSQGFATKIESRNAYVPCVHPERRQDCLYFLCSECGESAELADPRVEKLLTENATSLGYELSRRVIEIEGTCTRCSRTDSNEKLVNA